MQIDELLVGWGGEALVVRHDGPTQAWMIVGVDSTARGPAMGGTRMRRYRGLTDAVADVVRLSQAMTRKQALADLPFGGGKAVLAVPTIPDRGGGQWRGLLERYGDLVAALGGTYVTAADVNTGSAEMDVLGERTSHVLGRSPAHGGSGDPGPDTAVGVYHGIRAACARAFGSPDLASRSVAVQGAGSVGSSLLELLDDAGAATMVADVDEERARRVSESTAAVVVPASDVLAAPCDVLAPCATGGVLSADTIPTLRARVVAGAANNQLAAPDDARRLEEAGVVYAPDYVVNAGGVIHLAGYEALGWDEATVRARIAAIETTLGEVFALADEHRMTAAEAADRMARDRIHAARRVGH